MTSQLRSRATQVKVDFQLMQNYRLGSPLPAGAGRNALATAVGRDGSVQLFSIGTNGHVYNIFRDAASETGWSSEDMGGPPDGAPVEVVAGNDADGVLFAAAVAEVTGTPYFVDRIRDTRWNSTWQTAYASEGYKLSQLRAADGIGGCIERKTDTYCQIESLWGPLTFSLALEGVQPDDVSDWAIGTVASAPCCLICLDLPEDSGVQTFKVWTGPTFDTPGTYLNTVFSRLALTPNPAAAGTSAVFLLSADDNGIYQVLSDLTVDQPATTIKISGDAQLAELVACTNQDGVMEVFALGLDHFLYHVRQDPLQPGGWTTMMPIDQETQFGHLALGRSGKGQCELFAVAADHTLHHLWRDATTTDWSREVVEVGSTGDLEVLHSYTTELTVVDAQGGICPNTTVTVWSYEPTPVLINGRSYWIDEAAPAICTSDTSGKVTVMVQTTLLEAPLLQFATEFMENQESISVQPNADIQDKLSQLTGPELLNPTDPDGKPVVVLDPKYQTETIANAVADAVNQCAMLIGDSGVPGEVRYLAPGTRRRGVRHVRPTDARSPRAIDVASVPDQHWEVDYSSGFPVFRQLTRDAALARTAAMREGSKHARGIFGFDVDLGDVLNAAAQTVMQIADVVVTTLTENGIVAQIQLAIQLVIDGVNYLYEGLVNLIDQAFDLMRSVFARVVAGFKALFDWLEKLFNWTDILRTKEVLQIMIDQSFRLSSATIACVERNANDIFDTLKLQARNALDQVIEMDWLKGQSFQQLNATLPAPPPEYAPSFSYNVVATGFYNGGGGASDQATPASRLATSVEASRALKGVMDVLVEQADQLKNSKDFQRIVTYFEQMGEQLQDNPQQALQSALSGLLSTVSFIAQLALDVAKVIVSAILRALEAIISVFQDYLKAEWDNEFLRGIYRFATQDPKARLSLMDLLSLLFAVPTTIFYKSIAHHPPFPDDESVRMFRATFTQRVDQAIQRLGPSGAEVAAIGPLTPIAWPTAPADGVGKVPAWNVFAMGIGLGFYGLGSTGADLELNSEFGVQATPNQQTCSMLAIFGESLYTITSCPLITSDEAYLPGSGPLVEYFILWGFTSFTTLVDIYSFIDLYRKKLSLQGDIGTGISIAFGGTYCLLYGLLAKREKDANTLNVPVTIGNFFTAAPYLARAVRLSVIKEWQITKVLIPAAAVLEGVLYLGAVVVYMYSASIDNFRPHS